MKLSAVFENLILARAAEAAPPARTGRPRALSDSQVSTLLFKLLRTGCQWRKLECGGDLLVHWSGGNAITAIEVKHINRTNPTQKRKKVREQALYYASVAKFKQRNDSVSALAVTNESVHVVVRDMDPRVALAVLAKYWRKHGGGHGSIARNFINGKYGKANKAWEANGDVNKPASLLDNRVERLVESISQMLPCGQTWIRHTSTQPCESSCHW